jgi:hypothetical protein
VPIPRPLSEWKSAPLCPEHYFTEEISRIRMMMMMMMMIMEISAGFINICSLFEISFNMKYIS